MNNRTKLFLKNIIISSIIVFAATIFYYVTSNSIFTIMFLFIFNLGLLELVSEIEFIRKNDLNKDIKDELREMHEEIVRKLNIIYDKLDSVNKTKN